MKLRKQIGLGIAGLVFAGSAVGAVAMAGGTFKSDDPKETKEEAVYTRAHRDEVSVSKKQAEAAALKAHPGKAFDTHLQDEGQGLVWEVKVDDGSNVWEVQIDGNTGAIVSDQNEASDNDTGENEAAETEDETKGKNESNETGEEAAFTQAHKDEVSVSKKQAEAAALKAHPGRAFDTHLQDEGQGLVWEVKVDDGTNVWEVQIDGNTGAIVSDQNEASDNDAGESDDG